MTHIGQFANSAEKISNDRILSMAMIRSAANVIHGVR